MKSINEKIIKIISICFSITFLIVLFNTIFFNRTTQINYSIIFMIIALMVSYIIVYLVYKKYKNKIEPTKIQICTVILILFALQIIFAILTYAMCGWDCGIVMNSAHNLAINNKIDVSYFSRCPNNIGMLLLVTYIIKFISLFCVPTIVQAYIYTIIFNIIVIDISAILTVKVCKEIFGNKNGYFSVIFIIPLMIFLPYIIIPYTDTISMLFPILTLWLYTKVKKESNIKKKLLIILLGGFCVIIGYNIKPTIVIVNIAIFIVEILRCKNIKKFAICVLVFCVGCIISYFVCLHIENKNIGHLINKSDYEANAMPITHFVKMGLKEIDSGTKLAVKNRKYYGGDNKPDVETTIANKGKKEKIKENLDTISKRLKEFGINGYIKFLYNKMNWILSDGTFFFGNEGSFWKTGIITNSQIGFVLQKFLYNQTEEYQKVTANIFQTVWILLSLGVVCSYTRKYENNYIIISKVTIIGIVMFLLLFEGRARYLINHIPFFIIVGLYGLNISFEKIEKIKTKQQLLLTSKGENKNE